MHSGKKKSPRKRTHAAEENENDLNVAGEDAESGRSEDGREEAAS
jgi:hypothetical protein